MKLNLGCGKKALAGYVNIDMSKYPGVNVVHDLNKFPYPFKDDTFDFIYSEHVIEHLDDLYETMKELHRICKNGATMIIRVPHFSCGINYRDPTHQRLFSYFTFDYFMKSDWTPTGKWCYERPKEVKLFEVQKREFGFTRVRFRFMNPIINPFINLFPQIYERFLCWVFPCSECIFRLKVTK